MRKVFKSPFFWITLLSLLFAIGFIFFWDDISKTSFQDQAKRVLYASIFFLMVLIAQLSYLFLTKEEERETRRKKRELKKEERKKQREFKRLKKSAIKELRKTFYKALNIIKTNHIYKNRASHNYELPWYLVLGGDDVEHKAI
jgi:type VI protein secretion system component VasK